MRTVKQVSEFTGVSVRTLHYYDEIGLLKPTLVTDSGYRMYDDYALEALQQILFFKELDFTLKDIKTIMLDPNFDRKNAFENQKKLIKAKCDRLNGLLNLLEKLSKGEKCMSFKEFDMSEYFLALEEFKENNMDEVMKRWGSVEDFNKMVTNFKEKESEIAKMAIQQYGSIEKYTEAMKKNMENMEVFDDIKENASDYMERNKELHCRLTSDLSLDVSSEKVQAMTKELVAMVQESFHGIDMGENYWDLVIQGYLTEAIFIEANDKIYGKGSADFIGRALKEYWSKH